MADQCPARRLEDVMPLLDHCCYPEHIKDSPQRRHFQTRTLLYALRVSPTSMRTLSEEVERRIDEELLGILVDSSPNVPNLEIKDGVLVKIKFLIFKFITHD